jgi:magnesium transporter
MQGVDLQDEEKTTTQAILEWPSLSEEEKIARFKALDRHDAEDLFLDLSAADQLTLFRTLPSQQHRAWIRLLAPDDAADLIQLLPKGERDNLLALLDDISRREVTALLYYSEDQAGGLMYPRFIRLRPDISTEVALRYFRMQARQPVEFVDYAYVLDADQKLVGVVTLRDLLFSEPNRLIEDFMNRDVAWVKESLDQEEVGQKLLQLRLKAIPVCDSEGRMKGIVTVDDIIHVVQEEATEDIQKLGGTEALDEPYLLISLLKMVKKRAGWLVILFVSEMLTATAMGYFEEEISKAVVLALFIPLIISSGGNSGSQAASLIIRSLALKEVKPRDWFRIFSREVLVGLLLGAILGSIGLVRILLWPTRNETYGEHFVLIGMTVSASLVGVVLWGSLAGSMLPLLLKRLGLDPATASAPFVATLVDVTGIVIYFSIASLFLGGVLL